MTEAVELLTKAARQSAPDETPLYALADALEEEHGPNAVAYVLRKWLQHPERRGQESLHLGPHPLAHTTHSFDRGQTATIGHVSEIAADEHGPIIQHRVYLFEHVGTTYPRLVLRYRPASIAEHYHILDLLPENTPLLHHGRFASRDIANRHLGPDPRPADNRYPDHYSRAVGG